MPRNVGAGMRTLLCSYQHHSVRIALSDRGSCQLYLHLGIMAP